MSEIPNSSVSPRWAVAKLCTGTSLAQAVSGLSMLAIARLYQPEMLGEYALYQSVFTLCALAATLRLDVAVLSAKDEAEAAGLALLTLVCSAANAFVCAGIVAALWGAGAFGIERLGAPVIALIGAASAAAGMAAALRALHLRLSRFGSVGTATAAQSAIRGAVAIAAGWWRAAWIGLALSDIVASLGSLAWLAARAREIAVWKAWRARIKDLRGLFRAHAKYPLLVLPSSFADTLALCLPPILFLNFFGAAATGCFAFAMQIARLPMTLLGANVADVFHAMFAEKRRCDRKAAAVFFWQTFAALAGIGAAGYCVLFFWGRELFAFVFGAKWAEAGQYAAVMSAWMLAAFVVSPLSRVVFVTGRQELKFIYDGAAILAVVGAFSAGKMLSLSPLALVGVLAGLKALAYLLYFAILVRLTRGPDRAGPQATGNPICAE